MRREILYLTDIVEAADSIATFIAGFDKEQFFQSELVRSAVANKLTIIGEAASHISDALRSRERQVPWAQIVAFRNIVVHAYFGIDWDEVWNVASNRCPALREQVAQILVRESNRTE